jgi:cell division protein ZapA
MNIVTVKINGVGYNLRGEENDEYLHKVASYVDKKIKNIAGGNPKLSITDAAVLTAVNVVDDLFKCDTAYSELIKKVDELENDEKTLMNKLDSLKKQIEGLEMEKVELNQKIRTLQATSTVKEKDEKIEILTQENSILQETTKQQLKENVEIKAKNKELKFQLQSAKYKIIGLQNKIIESQMDLVKVKRSAAPYINSEEK